ncbi:MAG: hypothetical protein ACR2OZ_05645 [Verrucomicrobiales bacterium]
MGAYFLNWYRALFRALGEKVMGARRSHILVQAGLLVLVVLVWKFQHAYGAPWEGRLGRHLAAGKELRFEELIHVQIWWAACIDMMLVGVLLLLSPWWLHWAEDERSGRATVGASPRRLDRRTWCWIGLGLLLALAVRVPRLDQTITRDEQDTLRRNIIGFVYESGGDNPVAEIVDWKATLWEDKQANNPFLFSILARVTLRAWQWWEGAEPWRINRVVLRLWAIIPGVLSLAALWWSIQRMGFARAAIIALYFGALHPFHVNFSTQARGYALVLLFASLIPGFSWIALERGKWRHWCGLVACFFGCLYSFPGSFYFTGSWAVILASYLGWRWLRWHDSSARASLVRFAVTSCGAAFIFLPLVLPAVPQVAKWGREFRGALEHTWPVTAWSNYAAGVAKPNGPEVNEWEGGWNRGRPVTFRRGALEYLVQRYVPNEPLLFGFVFCLVPALMVVGLRQLCRRAPWAWIIFPASLFPAVLTYFIYRSGQTPYIFHWYLIYFLPVVLLLVALGLDITGGWLERRLRRTLWLPAVLFLLLLISVNLGGPGRLLWFPGPQTVDAEYFRGRYHFVTRPDGVTQRVARPLE